MMAKSRILFLLFVMLCIAGLWGYDFLNQRGESFSRVVNYTLTVQNKTGDFLKDMTIRVFAPVKETPQQKVKRLSVSRDFNVMTDESLNQMINIALSIPPYGLETISVESVIEISAKPTRTRAAYSVSPEKFIESADPRIVQLASTLKRPTTSESIDAIYEWIMENIKSVEYVRDDLGALHALETRQGDCTEQSYLFAALARALGIPTRVMAGFYLPERSRFKTGDYHNWVEYIDGTETRIADTIYKNLNRNGEKYITFRVLNSEQSEFPLSSQRFMSFDPRLEVVLN